MHPGLTHFFILLIAAFGLAAPLSLVAQNLPEQDRPAAWLRQQAIAHEHGEGVDHNPLLAAELYCQSARLGDAIAQYNLGWMYANGRGVERQDSLAAYFFRAAAQQGLADAKRMLRVVGDPPADPPACMRDPAPPPPPAFPTPPANLNYKATAPRHIVALVMRLAPLYRIEPQLALAIIAAESSFDALARSPQNAKGLMQLIPKTSERFKVQDPFDPAQNIQGGLTYLRWLLAYFEGDLALVLAAYNAGEGAVERHRGVPPFQETRNYVQRILRAVGAPVHPFDASITRPSPLLALLHKP